MVTLISPGLVLEMFEATEDYVITAEEFSGIIRTITEIVTGIFIFGAFGMLIGKLTGSIQEGGR